MTAIISFLAVCRPGNTDRGISLSDKEKNLDVNKVCLISASHDGRGR